jgi:hypothetical protein
MGKKLFFTVLCMALLLWSLEKIYDYSLRRNVNLKSSYVVSHQPNAEVLFLGPCEPLWMLDPQSFNAYTGLTAYNLATVHANFAENELMLELYLRHNKIPKYLIVYVTTESIDGSLNVFNTYNFPQFMGDRTIDSVLQDQDPAFYRYRHIPFMRYAYYSDFVNFNFVQGIKHAIIGRELPYFPDGFSPPHDIVWDNKMERFAKKYPQGRLFFWNASEERYLRKIITLAQKSDIQVILYESPMLNEMKPFVLNREEIGRKIAKLGAGYGVPYWVFDTLAISQSRNYFFSVLTTNEKGRAIFNKTFAAYFNRMYNPGNK